jgi:hypothetical protein
MLTGEAPSAAPSVAGPSDEALQYSHSGRRYLLGYGRDFFGIWDRQRPGPPIARFPRTDEGWRQAWLMFAAEEPYSTEVAIGAPTTGAAPGTGPGGGLTGWEAHGASTTYPRPSREVSGAWWLLPIFMGWLGGLIAWLVNRDADPRKARAMLWTGIAVSVLVILLVFPALRATGV